MANTDAESDSLVLHVLVVGFHHKKGCQVEYCYPPLIKGNQPDSDECPPGWKYLPTLAMPDGSHNFSSDTVYFHLPSLTNPNETVFGISCYRQIPLEKVKNRTADLTRGTVQKSVCVLSKVPLYGHIEVKMSLITHAYFEEGDFTKVSLLKDTYEHLSRCLNELKQFQRTSQFFDGLSAREFVLKFRHKSVLLFKLLLLEKRVLFYGSPVHLLCTTMLSLLSLYPGMLENGLHEAACIRTSRPMSPVPEFSESEINDNIEASQWLYCDKAEDVANTLSIACEYKREITEYADLSSNDIQVDTTLTAVAENGYNDSLCVDDDSDKEQKNELDLVLEDTAVNNNILSLEQLNFSVCHIPLPIFTEGYLCLPYLSLPYMDLLTDPNVRGYAIGATNILFKQKRHLIDVLIEVEDAKVETNENELKRLLHLSTADLRFADYILKHVTEEKDVFIDNVGWEGSDEWIRVQFEIYLLSLLRTSLLPDNSRELDHFNSSFVSAWKDTNNYKTWIYNHSEDINFINPSHPFAGQLSVADMKLRLSHTMQNTESGRKLNQAMLSTGRAVGGAFLHARGTFSAWWANLTNTGTSSGEVTAKQ